TFGVVDAGKHTFTGGVAFKTSGSQSLTATDTVNGGLTAKATVSVSAAAAATLSLTVPATAVAGSSFNATVTLTDAYGNVASGYAGTVHFTSSDSKAVLPGDYTFTSGDAGRHTFVVTLNTLGSQTVTAADSVNSALQASATVSVAPKHAIDIQAWADGYAKDPDSDGVFESVDTTNTLDKVSYLLGTSVGEDRAIVEFSVANVDPTATI